jgi:hypothetical protein
MDEMAKVVFPRRLLWCYRSFWFLVLLLSLAGRDTGGWVSANGIGAAVATLALLACKPWHYRIVKVLVGMGLIVVALGALWVSWSVLASIMAGMWAFPSAPIPLKLLLDGGKAVLAGVVMAIGFKWSADVEKAFLKHEGLREEAAWPGKT